MITVSRDRDNFQLKYVSAETTLKESEKQVKEIEQLNKQLSETKNKNELLQHEIDALKVSVLYHLLCIMGYLLVDHTFYTVAFCTKT